ncbi:MAG: nucleoside hydrolase [Candidatus Acidiferrales bacterium]
MKRDPRPNQDMHDERNGSEETTGVTKNSAWSRREFLRTSSGLAAAGALGGFAAQLPASARELLPRTNASTDSSQSAPTPGKPRRVIIDTDPGIDDALAIFLALRSPELQVEAITPVCGNVPLEFTLPNALRLVEIAGRPDIPVAAGASHPLVRRLVTAGHVHGANGLAGVDFPEPKIKPVRETAPELIRRVVRENPGVITLVAIGPLTNVALALRDDPELAAMIPEIVIMGGSLSGGNITPAAEFNLYVDPEAARIVFDAHIPLTMVGLDVTRKCQISEHQIQQLEAAQNPVSQAAGKIMRATFERMKHGGEITVIALHDPLTVASLIDPGVITRQDFYVEVETLGEWTAGETLGYDGRGPVRKSAPLETSAPGPTAPVEGFQTNAKVAMGVDPDRFFRLLIPRLTGTAA